MANLVLAYNEDHKLEVRSQYLPPDTKFANLVGITSLNDSNLEIILRMLLKQLAAENCKS